MTEAWIHLGMAAVNIDVLLPQLAGRGLDVSAVGNQIHGLLWDLRRAGTRLIKQPDADPDQAVVVDRQIKSLLRSYRAGTLEIDGHRSRSQRLHHADALGSSAGAPAHRDHSAETDVATKQYA